MDFVDVVKRFPTNIVFVKIGFDTAENEPFKVWGYGVSTPFSGVNRPNPISTAQVCESIIERDRPTNWGYQRDYQRDYFVHRRQQQHRGIRIGKAKPAGEESRQGCFDRLGVGGGEREKERGRVSIFWKPVLGCIEADFSIKD